MWKKSLRLVPFALALVLPGVANAEPMACSSRNDVLAQLARDYKESPVGIGLASNGGLLEVLTSGDGATWTIIITMPNGTSCLMAAGESWQSVLRVALDEPQI